MLILLSFVFIAYAVCVFILNKGYNRIQNKSPVQHEASQSFSILIPFHNEEKHLPQLCESLSKLKYPTHLFELIFIDDFSTDQSEGIIKNFNFPDLFSVIVISSVKKWAAPKKDALQIGISQARFK
ncbi:MAG: glycosyltransferase, partial [Bacteroidetes bacterium]|nr:glycosyltransferase [Bacteroidota bacterium]